jgi:hypothetical protein
MRTIILAAAVGEEQTVEALQLGAWGIVLKESARRRGFDLLRPSECRVRCPGVAIDRFGNEILAEESECIKIDVDQSPCFLAIENRVLRICAR